MDKTELGTLTKWNEAGSYGFIKPNGGPLPDLFVHIRDCGGIQPSIGSTLEYVPYKQPDGRWRARNARPPKVKSSEAAPSALQRSKRPILSKLVAILLSVFAATWSWATLLNLVPVHVHVYMATINLVTVVAYWRDKQSASRGGQRTPEVILHGLEVLGGWPAAWLAQHLFRHKSSKRSYQRVFLLMVICNLVAVAVWLNARWNISTLALPA